MVITPGDILARCQLMSGRIAQLSRIINDAPGEQIDELRRQAWLDREKRWATLRSQCSDYASRMWAWKWVPTLEDWEKNQTEWEHDIAKLTGQPVPTAAPVALPADETMGQAIDTMTPNMPNLSKSLGTAVIIVAGGAAAALAVFAWQRARR